MSCNSATHATCSLALSMYKYSELQMSFAIQKLGCKARCKAPFCLIVKSQNLKRSNDTLGGKELMALTLHDVDCEQFF